MFKKVLRFALWCTLVLSANSLYSMQQEGGLYEQFRAEITHANYNQKSWYPQALRSLFEVQKLDYELKSVIVLLKEYDSNKKIAAQLDDAFKRFIGTLKQYSRQHDEENEFGGISETEWDYPQYGCAAREVRKRVKQFRKDLHLDLARMSDETRDFLS